MTQLFRALILAGFAVFSGAVHAVTSSWWDFDFTLRQLVTVTTGANSPDKGYQAYTLRISGVDTAALVAAGEMQANCEDLRITYFDGTAWQELDRHVLDCNTTATDIRFASPIDLVASANEDNFYLYYSNASAAAAAPLTTTNVYLWFDDATVDRLSDYDTGRGDPFHGTLWDNSLSWNAAGYYEYDTGDNFTSTYRRPVDERDVYTEVEFNHSGCYNLNMTTGIIVRGISTGAGATEASTHHYTSNRGHQGGGGCNTGGYGHDGDILEDNRNMTVVNGANPPAIVRNQWRRQGLAAWDVNSTNLEFWDEDDSAAWNALGYPDSGNSHVAGTDATDNEGRGYAGFLTAQDIARVRNVLIRRYTLPEPALALGPQEALPPPMLSVSKSVTTVSDPISSLSNPKAIPGAHLDYLLTVSNPSVIGGNDPDSIALVDTLPPNADLFVNDLITSGGGPVVFEDGTGAESSGIAYTFVSLGSTTDDVDFSVDGVNFGYVPVPDANGFDSNVTHLRLAPKGAFNVATSLGVPQFTLRFRVRSN